MRLANGGVIFGKYFREMGFIISEETPELLSGKVIRQIIEKCVLAEDRRAAIRDELERRGIAVRDVKTQKTA